MLFRAVTDCTVGSEHVLGESNVIHVTKDITLPKPIYLPEPADGVLGEGDNISINYDDKTDMKKDLVNVLGRQPSAIAVVGNKYFAKVAA